MATAPLINGRRYSYASIELALKLGATSQSLVIDVDEINYSEALTIAFKQGTARVPIGSTSGVWESQEGSLVIGKSSMQDLINTTGPGWLGINMVMLVSYFDIGEPLTVDTIVGRLTKLEDAQTYGPDALKSTLSFMPITPILRNGISSMLNRVF